MNVLRSCLLAGALTAAFPAAAQKPASDGDGQSIVVTGRRTDDTRRALEACLARKCPPVEDMAATLAHAENLFVSGDYRTARTTVQAGVRRNDRYAREHPREVATLYRADARISIHLGDGETYRNSTYGAVRALKKGLDDDDRTVLTARFDVAQMLARLGRLDEARLAYDQIARDAAGARARDLAAEARIRSAWLGYVRLKSSNLLEPIEKVAASTDPELKGSRLSALVLLARADRARGRTEGQDRLLKALAEAHLDRPTLLWAPPVEPPAYATNFPSYNNQGLSTASERFEKTWADVGFWVKPDGTVSEAEILRSSGKDEWLKPVLRSISQRIYSPSADPTGSYRVERYTWTSLVRAPSGSRIDQHSPQGRIEFVDLTPDAPPGDSSR